MIFIKRIVSLTNNLVKNISNLQLHLSYWIITFISIVIIRNIIEGIFEATHTIGIVKSINLSVGKIFNHYIIFCVFLRLYDFFNFSLITDLSICVHPIRNS